MMNPKFKLIEIILGPLMRFVESKNITIFVIGIIIYIPIIIWDLKKRKKVKLTTTWRIREIILFMTFLIGIIYAIYDQIRILRNLRWHLRYLELNLMKLCNYHLALSCWNNL